MKDKMVEAVMAVTTRPGSLGTCLESRDMVAADLSVIVVSWNTRDLLEKCLTSVNRAMQGGGNAVDDRSESLSMEILVVDNASTDGSAEMVREKFPGVKLIQNGENVGFARANNQAIKVSTGRFLLLLNPDTDLMGGTVESLVRFMEERPAAGAAGPRLLNPNGSLQVSCYPVPTLSRELWRLLHLDVVKPYSCYPKSRWTCGSPQEVGVIQGACLILRREALSQVGLLDEDFFIYSEEVDLCLRLRQHKWLVHWIPNLSVVHHGGQSTCQVPIPMFIWLYRGKTIFFRKHAGRWHARLYKLILLFATLVRLTLLPFVLLEPSEKRRRYFASAANYWTLLRTLPEL